MVASLDGADYALWDSGSGLTSCQSITLTVSHLCRDPSTCQSRVTPLEVAWNVLVKDKVDIDLRMVNHLL